MCLYLEQLFSTLTTEEEQPRIELNFQITNYSIIIKFALKISKIKLVI